MLQDLPVDIREMLLGDQTSHTSQTCQTNQTMLAPPIGREVWRLFVNGEQMDEWNQDKLLQGYACALLDYYNPYFKNNKQSYFPSCPINQATNETTAFLNGFCIWFSSALKGTTSVQVGDTVYDLAADPSSNNLKGADNEGAIAAALYQLHIPKGILKAALTPGDTGTSAFGIIRLANELSGLGYDVEGTFQRYGLLPCVTQVTTSLPSPKFTIFSENATDYEITIAKDIGFKEIVAGKTGSLAKGNNLVTAGAGLSNGDYYYRLRVKEFRSKPYGLRIRITGTNSLHIDDATGGQLTNVAGNIHVNMPANAVGEDYTLSVEGSTPGALAIAREIANADNNLPQNLERIEELTASFIVTTVSGIKGITFTSNCPTVSMNYNQMGQEGVLTGVKGNSVPLSTLQVYWLAADMSCWQLSNVPVNIAVKAQAISFCAPHFSTYCLIGRPVGRIELSPKTASLSIGDTATFTATVLDRDGQVITVVVGAGSKPALVDWSVTGGECEEIPAFAGMTEGAVGAGSKPAALYKATMPGTYTICARVGNVQTAATITVTGEPTYRFSQTRQSSVIDLGEVCDVGGLRFGLDLPAMAGVKIRYRTGVLAAAKKTTTHDVVNSFGGALSNIQAYYDELNRVMTEDLGIPEEKGPPVWGEWSGWNAEYRSQNSEYRIRKMMLSLSSMSISY